MKKHKLFITCFFSLLSFSVIAQWEWQNPYPQGNHLNEVFCINQCEGWVAGDLGSVLKTTDGGMTFEKMECPVQVNLNTVEFFNSNLGFCAGDHGTLLKVNTDGISWSILEVGISADLKDICLIDPNYVWVVGDKGTLLHSTDEGNTWEQQYNDTSVCLNSVCFLDAINGWAVGGNNSGEGVVLQTSDGGETWGEISGGTIPPLSVAFFIDTDVGWAVMTDGTVYRSLDGGISWVLQFPDPPATMNFRDIFFTDADNGWAVGVSFWVPIQNSVILHTYDGGETWEPQEDYSWRGFNSVFFTDPGHGCAVGSYGTVTCTPDGGNTWVVLSGGYSRPALYDVFFTGEEDGWAVGGNEYPFDSKLMHTIDGGNSWEEMEATENILYGIFFINSSKGWIVGGPALNDISAIILNTENGGLSWETQYQGTGSLSFKDVCFTDPNQGWAVGGSNNVNPPNGTLLFHTINGGNIWEDQSWITDKSLSAICFTDPDHGWIVGHEVIMNTNNGGQTWEELWNGIHSWKEVCFIDPDHGWVLGDSIYGSSCSDIVMRTSNGGVTWVKQYFDQSLEGICFTDIYRGWIVGQNGIILFTNDGGNTWEIQYSNTIENLYGVSFIDQDKGWIVGSHTAIFHNDNGGLVQIPNDQKPKAKSRLQTYPNPFSNQTTIKFTLPESEFITLSIYDITGKHLETILSKKLSKGNHKINWNAEGLIEGVYFIRLETNTSSIVQKVVILK